MKKILIYDFDGTLTPYPVPRFEILEKCGIIGKEIDNFYLQIRKKAVSEKVDLYQVLFETYFETIKNAGFKLIDDNFA